MSFNVDGFVLRPPRVAPSNATSTGEALNGVVRDHKPLPSNYDFFSTADDLIEVNADMYRTAVLQNPDGSQEEYLLWAANSSSLSLLETSDWTQEADDPAATVSIPAGTLEVSDTTIPGSRTDGTANLVVEDTGGRALSEIRQITIRRGDTGAEIEVGPDAATGFDSQDADGGLVTLGTTTLTALGGGVSTQRGDTIVQVSYIIAAARFWWTRNDSTMTRFGWNGSTQRWEPFKGSSPKRVGVLQEDTRYELSPKPSRFDVGDTLPAGAGAYSLIRVGLRPDEIAQGIAALVVSDQTFEDEVIDFAGLGDPVAVIGETNGILVFNPTTVDSLAGQAIWYNPEQFNPDSNGAIGKLIDAENGLYLSPVPHATDRPFVRLGFRRYLTPVAVDDDSALSFTAVGEGSFAWSRTTGKIRLSDADVAKADPDDPGFDVQYLGSQVYYDGVSLTEVSVPTPDPVQLVDGSGTPTTVGSSNDLYIPDATPLPFAGVSGIRFVPDGTGNAPDTSVAPATRPNESGLVRQVLGVGDNILFAPSGAIEELRVVEFESDLPDFPFLIRRGRAWVAREEGSGGSKVSLGLKDRNRFDGQALYFLQAEVTPAIWVSDARIYSRNSGPFTFFGTENLYFSISGITYTWNASTLTPAPDPDTGTSYTAVEVATSINSVISSGGSSFATRGRVVLESAGAKVIGVEIGFGSTTALEDRDFSAASILGFLPGWRASGFGSWLPDNGTSLGVFRSPLNKDRSDTTPDIKARDSFDNILFSESVPASQYFRITNPPLQDVAGFDENVFFLLADGLNISYLENFDQVLYDFGNDRIAWLDEGRASTSIQNVTFNLELGNPSVVPETLHPFFGTGLQVSEDGSTFTQQQLDTDFLLPGSGGPGLATLIDRYGAEVTDGAGGSFSSGTTTFTDPQATLITDGVQPGYLLYIVTGDAQGFYTVISVTSETEMEVEQLFTADAGGSEPKALWVLYTGFDTSVYNPGLVADRQYEQFNHLSEEPMKIRLLDNLGATPADSAAQSSSRLVAVVTEAYQRGRDVSLRFGEDPAEADGTATLTPLVKAVELGTIANGTLFITDLADIHWLTQAFAIRVGTKTYTLGTDITLVGAFTNPTGDEIEILTSTGELYFGDATLENLSGSRVFYDQTFLNPAQLNVGEAEYDPLTGELNFSDADMAAFGGITAWFIERMITEDQLDVVISPLAGSLYLQRPLRSGQAVEAEYWAADSSGNRSGDPITEILPVFIQLEEATRVDGFTYTINPTGRTIADTDPLIWVGPNLQNFGNSTTATLNAEAGTISFANEVDPGETVQVNYAVYEGFGGEQAFTVSTLPVYRPPFFLPEAADSFTLETDRTGDMVPGKLLRLGSFPYYIKSATYDAVDDSTTVEVFPSYESETGSRAPGNDVLTLISDTPITDDVDGTSTGAVVSGFMLDLPSAEYEPVDKGMLSIIFKGDLTRYAVAGHVLEMAGIPHIIVGSELADDGRTTRVELSSPAIRGFEDSNDAVRISARPIYPPSPTSFLGVFPLVPTEPYQLLLFGETDDSGNELPGRLLNQTIHYEINPETGAVELLPPVQQPLQPGQRLLLNYTKLRVLSPFAEDGALVFPKYKAEYRWVTPATSENGLLGATLAAKYTFRSPDSFYYRTVPLENYMGEVSQLLIQRVSGGNPSGGAVVVSGPSQKNYDFGRFGLLGERRDLFDQDRAARAFIKVYNETVVAFEQVRETLNGEVIGDRDGKFRFFVGTGKTYAPPGYEDQITGDLNPRFVWGDVFYAGNGSFRVTAEDKLVDPETATQDPVTFEVDGDVMNPFVLQFYIDQQKFQVANDMDDIVLIGVGRPRLAVGTLPGVPNFSQGGLFAQMWQNHILSRLFPETTLAFTTLYPGLQADLENGDPGVYAFLKMLNPPALFKKKDEDSSVFGSTFGKTVGTVSNPAVGLVKNITDIAPRERLPRARIWAYSSEGFPELDSAWGISTEGFATIIATPGYIKDFPVDEDGNPDYLRLASITPGGVPDIVTGDAELSNPGFLEFDDTGGFFKKKIIQQVALGRPTGETYGVGNAKKTIKSLFGGGVDLDSPVYEGVFIARIYNGCIIVLGDGSGNELSGTDVLELGSGELSGDPIAPVQGDTIYVIPPGSQDSADFSDPPTVEEQEQFAENLPNYRAGFDILTKRRKGEFADISLPSFKDPSPFGFKELTGQKPPTPLSAIEADVEFVNTAKNPLQFPALQGQPFNDSGDYGIPYLNTGNTELDRLGGVAEAFRQIGQADAPAATGTQAWKAIYPDEILGTDGSILDIAASDPPATLLTAQNLVPVNGTYTDNSGVGDVRAYDLLFIERGQAGVPDGIEGILSVANTPSASDNYLETPRFVTPTQQGDTLKYTLKTAMSHISSSFTSGISIQQAPSGPNIVSTFDISTVGGLFFNDGTTAPSITGGLNNIFASNNALILRLFENGGGASPGSLVEEIVITGAGGVAVGGAGVNPIVSVTADEKEIVVTTSGGGFVSNTGTTYDFTLDIDTYIDATTDGLIGGASPGIGNGSGSTTAFIDADRLTFKEDVDLRTMVERGTTTATGAVDITSDLAVHQVTTSGTLSTVNAPAEVNGGDAFTFLARQPGGDIGTFDPAPGTGEGSCKVMAFEGHNNTVIGLLTDITFSAAPSSEVGALGVIADGTGTAFDGDTYIQVSDEVTTVTSGALSRIVSGDILVIEESATGDGANKAGTYLVRHVVPENGPTFGVHETILTRNFGSSLFPEVVGFDEAPGTVELTLTTGAGIAGTGWASAGRLWLIPSVGDITQAVSAAYTTGDGVNFTLSNFEDNSGGSISKAAFYNVISTGMLVSGMRWFPISTGLPSPFPPNNTVGFDHGSTTVGGYLNLTLSNPGITGDATVYAKTVSVSGTDLVDSTGGSPGAGEVGIVVGPKVASTGFIEDESTPIYDGVATFLDLDGLATADWEAIHGDAAFWGTTPVPAVNTLFPSDKLVTTDTVDANGNDNGGTPGFQALAGIFLEPSFPRPTTDLNVGPQVVDDGTTVASADEIGWRDAGSFSGLTNEDVRFEVRRIRRFHEQLSVATSNLLPLRYAYEIRRGTVLSYGAIRPFGYTLTADTTPTGAATQLGPFNDFDVNVNAGDLVRILDANGNVLDTAEVSFVQADSVSLKAPGFVEYTPTAGDTFEVYLRTPPVPQEQSNQQLYELITDEVVHTTVADFASGSGGRVDDFNELKDTTVADFTALDIQVGDIIVIDPAGDLEGPSGPASIPERGSRPIGDTAVAARAEHVPGGPSELDDNRGFYRVEEVLSTHLVVSGVSDFTGEAGSEVIFGASGQEFAVMPTITSGNADAVNPNAPAEGQQDLRATRPAGADSGDPNSFKGNSYSIEPFSYTVIRPSTLYTEETVNLVLFIRERMLSWLEEISVATTGGKSGDYYTFQDEEHIVDLGSPTDPDDGLGVMSNLFLTSLSGEVGTSPFINTSDALSVLDRRVWVLDFRLDTETPLGSSQPYTSLAADATGGTPGSGRPVLPDRIDDVLDLGQRLRQLRYAWIKFRSNRVDGTLQSIIRFEEELPERIEEQEELLRLKEGLGEV